MNKMNDWLTIASLWGYIGVSWLLNEYVVPHIEPVGARLFIRGVDFAVLCVVGAVCVGVLFESSKSIFGSVKALVEARSEAQRSDP
jgi:hypothetical protein